MKFHHTLTLLAPYGYIDISNGYKLKVSPRLNLSDEQTGEWESGPIVPANQADFFAVEFISANGFTYTLAECPDFKTADAFVKILESLL